MTEVTKDEDTKTNVFVESQTIRYALNPEAFKEDIQKAKNEIHDIYHTVDSTVNPQGEESRNVLQQLAETRQAKTILNVVGSRLEIAENQEDIAKAFEGVSEDLGYKVKIIYTDPSNSPQLIGVDKDGNTYIKDGTAYVDKDTGINYILINSDSLANRTKAGVIGTIAEEQSHIIGKIEERQKLVPDGSEKGLESLGRPTNDYFKNQFSKNDKAIGIVSDGKDYSNVDFGENVGDYISPEDLKYRKYYREEVLPYDEAYQNFLKTTFSVVLDFSPLGITKGITEGIIGYDIVTGEKLDLASRIIGVVPVANDVFKTGRRGVKLLKPVLKPARKVETVLADGSKVMLNIDDTIKSTNKVQKIISSSDTTKAVVKETKVIDKTTDIAKASKNIEKVSDVSEDIVNTVKRPLQDVSSIVDKNLKKVDSSGEYLMNALNNNKTNYYLDYKVAGYYASDIRNMTLTKFSEVGVKGKVRGKNVRMLFGDAKDAYSFYRARVVEIYNSSVKGTELVNGIPIEQWLVKGLDKNGNKVVFRNFSTYGGGNIPTIDIYSTTGRFRGEIKFKE